MPNQPSRHHYVTRSYLERFRSYGKLHCLHQGGQVYPASPRDTAVIREFNTVFTDTRMNTDLEGAVCDIEGAAFTAIRHIDASLALTDPADILAISSFIVLLHVNNPVQRELLDKATMWEYEIRKDIACHSLGLNPSDYGLKVTLPVGYHAPTTVSVAIELASLLTWRKWSVLQATGLLCFLTSDNPVIVDTPDGRAHLGNRRADIIFPLSSRICLIGHSCDANDSVLDPSASDDIVRRINLRTRDNIHRVLCGDKFSIEDVMA